MTTFARCKDLNMEHTTIHTLKLSPCSVAMNQCELVVRSIESTACFHARRRVTGVALGAYTSEVSYHAFEGIKWRSQITYSVLIFRKQFSGSLPLLHSCHLLSHAPRGSPFPSS
jgi:hypothetical protein